jgi:hypothetical protein
MQHNVFSANNSRSAGQEIPRLLYHSYFHLRAHNSPPLVVPLAKSIHFTPSNYIYRFRSVLILYSRLSLSLPSTLFLQDFGTKTLYTRLIAMRTTHHRPSHPNDTSCSFLCPPVTSSLLDTAFPQHTVPQVPQLGPSLYAKALVYRKGK